MSAIVLRVLYVASHLFLTTDHYVGSTIITVFWMRRVNPGEIKTFAEIKAGKQQGQDLNHYSLSPAHLHLTTSLCPSGKLKSIVPSWEV